MGIRTPFDPLGTTGNQRGLPFTFTIDTTKNIDDPTDSTFIVPLTAGTYSSLSGISFGIVWGDGEITVITDGVFTQENCTHTYAEPGQYTVSIKSNNDTAPRFNFYENYASINNNLLKIINTKSGIIPQIDINGDEILVNTFATTFRECSNLTSITADLFKNSPNITVNAFVDTFHTCTNLRSIPINLFRYNTKVTTNAFNCTFCNCFALTAIPTNLFRYNTEVSFGAFVSTFYNCRTITSIPDNLFLYNTKVSESGFNTTFGGCTNLTTIPTNLFYTNMLCTSFIRTFIGCTKLTINPYIFGNYDINPSLKTTRFNNDKTYNFTEMFYRDSFTGTAGTAGTPGDFWIWTYQNTPVSEKCYGGEGNTTVVCYNDIPEAWGGPIRYRITVNPTPSNASVLLQTLGGLYPQVGNHMDVLYGTQVRYTVSKQWYETASDIVTVTDDITLNIVLDPILHTLTVEATPVDALISLTAPGYTQAANTISVPWETDVDWTVSRAHYTTQSGTKTVTLDETMTVDLVPESYTINITPTPSDAIVMINNLQRTSATFTYNTEVTWSVSKTDYVTQGNTFYIDENTNLNIDLHKIQYTVTIIPTPSDATVIINGIERTSATLDIGTTVTYSVTKPGYASAEDTFTLTNNIDIEIELDPIVRLTINPTPSDATITLTAEYGEQVDNYIEVPANDPITWSVSKADYVTQDGTTTITADTTWNITLRRTTYKFEIVPTPQNATVIMTCSDPNYVQEPGENYILAPADTTVDWSVTRAGCDPQSGTQAIGREPITLPVVLVGHTYVDVEDYNYTENASGVTITRYVGSGTIIEAPHLEQES